MVKSKILRILLADDNPALHSALALQLETRLNARVVGEAYNMDDLLTNLNLLHPNLVILDWDLPGLPKTGQLTALRKLDPELKIVIIASQPEVAQLASNAHADAYVCRCDPPEQMVQVLQGL
jgi:DNA-binding NarL/FixJ family response regulator